MSYRNYIWLWLSITAICSIEYLAIQHKPSWSLLMFLKYDLGFFEKREITTHAGKSVSYLLGWLGFGIMCITNLYILRKRTGIFGSLGKLPGWLDFHIFCGLLGPTFIVFHSDFKVRGLVSISFWSMIVVAASGVIGRYFYVQVLNAGSKADGRIERLNNFLQRRLKKARCKMPEEKYEKNLKKAMLFAGVPPETVVNNETPSMFAAVSGALIGDLRMLFGSFEVSRVYPQFVGPVFEEIAYTKRQALLAEYFQKLLGYWHSFHIPFTFSMYVTAVIHIIVAELFSVPG